MAPPSDENNIAIIGAGLFGLVTAKVLLHDTNHSFSDITIFEKSPGLGGVWSQDRIYPGLASNSPALTYEIPGFQFPDKLRRYGSHVKAEDINVYLSAFTQQFDLERHISFNSLVDDVSWGSDTQRWRIRVKRDGDGDMIKEFKFLVVCNGMYHQPNIPNILTVPSQSQSSLSSRIYHSADVGDPEIRMSLAKSEHTLVVGAGKSAIDLATMIARGEWSSNKRSNNPPRVTLLYKRPHWLSPRSIVRGTIYFERLLFSRFLNAWLPFASNPDALHAWIAQSPIGKWMTDTVFKLVADDFVKSCRQQDLPQTIPDHPFREALSGALHVVPEGYLEFVRSGQIKIMEGSISSISNSSVNILTKDGESKKLDIDHILYATGYKIAFPFLTPVTLRNLGIIADSTTDPNDLPHLKLHRLLVPPATIHRQSKSQPYQNIAFNGFAYSLLNPTVSFVAAHWIAAYFLGQIPVPRPSEIEHEIDGFYNWQRNTFAKHGAKGVHIGSHATLYSDLLLKDMGVETGHLEGSMLNPVRLAREWFRPMYPQIYAGLGDDLRKVREGKVESARTGLVMGIVDFFWVFLSTLWTALVNLFSKR